MFLLDVAFALPIRGQSKFYSLPKEGIKSDIDPTPPGGKKIKQSPIKGECSMGSEIARF
jgi:hypothetical protein